MPKTHTFVHDREAGTVTVTHHGFQIRDYAEIKSGQLASLLAILGEYETCEGDLHLVTVMGLAQDLAHEMSSLVEAFTRTDCLGVNHG
jgi:hypothetical protein